MVIPISFVVATVLHFEKTLTNDGVFAKLACVSGLVVPGVCSLAISASVFPIALIDATIQVVADSIPMNLVLMKLPIILCVIRPIVSTNSVELSMLPGSLILFSIQKVKRSGTMRQLIVIQFTLILAQKLELSVLSFDRFYSWSL